MTALLELPLDILSRIWPRFTTDNMRIPASANQTLRRRILQFMTHELQQRGTSTVLVGMTRTWWGNMAFMKRLCRNCFHVMAGRRPLTGICQQCERQFDPNVSCLPIGRHTGRTYSAVMRLDGGYFGELWKELKSNPYRVLSKAEWMHIKIGKKIHKRRMRMTKARILTTYTHHADGTITKACRLLAAEPLHGYRDIVR